METRKTRNGSDTNKTCLPIKIMPLVPVFSHIKQSRLSGYGKGLHLVHPKMIPAEIHVSHSWRREWHQAEAVHVHKKNSILHKCKSCINCFQMGKCIVWKYIFYQMEH